MTTSPAPHAPNCECAICEADRALFICGYPAQRGRCTCIARFGHEGRHRCDGLECWRGPHEWPNWF